MNLHDELAARTAGVGVITNTDLRAILARHADETEMCSTRMDAAAVERVARVLVEDGRFGVPWEDASEDDRVECLANARRLLDAAVKESA